MPPIVQRIYEREHLHVMNQVVVLELGKLAGSVCNKPRQSLSIQLRQRRSHTDIVSIRMYDIRL